VIIPSTKPVNCLGHSSSSRRSSTLSLVRTLSFSILAFFEHSAVFVIRYVERRTDQLLDAAILDHSPLPSEFDGIQFESEWSLLRSLTPKRKVVPGPTVPQLSKNGIPNSPSLPSQPISPIPSSPPPSHRGLSSLKQSFSRSHSTPIQSMLQDIPSGPNPSDLTSVFDALQTFLILSGVNPALITQLWSQVFYWIACEVSSIISRCFAEDSCVGEVFNRVLSRKKYLCRCAGIHYFSVVLADVTHRSRAVQIGANLSALEEWVEMANLPRSVRSHLAPVRDLLNWLQVSCLKNVVAALLTQSL
jgi:hypothetical protein